MILFLHRVEYWPWNDVWMKFHWWGLVTTDLPFLLFWTKKNWNQPETSITIIYTKKHFFAIMPFFRPNQHIKSNALFFKQHRFLCRQPFPVKCYYLRLRLFLTSKAKMTKKAQHGLFRISVIAWMRTTKNVKRNKLEKNTRWTWATYCIYIVEYQRAILWIKLACVLFSLNRP